MLRSKVGECDRKGNGEAADQRKKCSASHHRLAFDEPDGEQSDREPETESRTLGLFRERRERRKNSRRKCPAARGLFKQSHRGVNSEAGP